MKAFSRILMPLVVLVLMTGTASPALDLNLKVPDGNQDTIEGIVNFMERDGTIVVCDPEGKSRVLYVRGGAKIRRDKSEIAYEQLKAGDRIRATTDSMRQAIEVQVLKPSARQ